MYRRRFIRQCGLAAAGCWYPALTTASQAADAGKPGAELETDLLIIGGGLGGCAAALAATNLGIRVVMTEPTDWIGGQLSQQAVPPDEHAWIESFGCTRNYRLLRENIRDWYRRNRPLTPEATARKNLDPGDGSVSRLCHEPRVAVAVLDEMLAPAVAKGRLTLMLNTRPVTAEIDGDRVRVVRLTTGVGREVTVRAKYFIDASETGALLPLTSTEYVTGSESQRETGEPNASPEARPQNMQSCTWCFAMEYLPGEDHTIDRPAQYDFWHDYRPELTPPWPPHPLLSLWYSQPHTCKPLELSFLPPDPAFKNIRTKTLNLWLYRRILNRANFQPGTVAGDVTIVNWPQNDYMPGNVFELDKAERTKHWDAARQLSLSLLYWLQTECPRPDGKTGWKGLRPCGRVVGTADGLAKFPYIRESRRIKAEFTVLEQHVRPPAGRKIGDQPVARAFADSVGVGHYSMDLHPSTGGDNYFHVGSLPYQIPLGALIPRRVENLLAGCKNIGATHLTNGAYRLHPTEWNIGEAAGVLVAFCLTKGQPPRRVRNHEPLLAELQAELIRQGFDLDWSKLAS